MSAVFAMFNVDEIESDTRATFFTLWNKYEEIYVITRPVLFLYEQYHGHKKRVGRLISAPGKQV